MATDQNIKNKTLASDIDTAYGRHILQGKYIYINADFKISLYVCVQIKAFYFWKYANILKFIML